MSRQIRYFVTLVSIFTFLSCLDTGAQEVPTFDFEPAPRHAIVFGVENYIATGIKPVPNAKNDAIMIADILSDLGFDTQIYLDADASTIYNVVRNLDQLRLSSYQADEITPLVVFFFAGHGFSSNGWNYVAPHDINNSSSNSILDTSIPISSLFEGIIEKSIVLAILDSCRSPLRGTDLRINVGFGGQEIWPSGSQYFIGFSAGFGRTARSRVKRSDKNSPFTTALSTHLGKQDETIESIWHYVRRDTRNLTIRDTLESQEPEFRPGLNVKVHVGKAPIFQAKTRQVFDEIIHRLAQTKSITQAIKDFQGFRENYPLSGYSNSARRIILLLKELEAIDISGNVG